MTDHHNIPDRPLFRQWPALAASLPFIELGDMPTAIDVAAELGAELNIGTLLIKRDDLSAADYGGNKIRKLEFLLADALAQHKTHVVTFGGLASNHAVATALNCKKLGLTCGAVLTPEPETDAVRAALAKHEQLGTRIERSGYTDLRACADRLTTEFGVAQTYEVPFGGSSAVGALGFVNAALELAEQIAAGELAAPDLIYVACGTVGTVAGLALGLAMAGLECRIEAVLVTPESLRHGDMAERLIAGALELLRPAVAELPTVAAVLAHLQLRADQLGGGYAEPTAACQAAAELWQTATGQPVSLTYTAKAVAALVEDARAGKLSDKTVLFWNTYNSQVWSV